MAEREDMDLLREVSDDRFDEESDYARGFAEGFREGHREGEQFGRHAAASDILARLAGVLRYVVEDNSDSECTCQLVDVSVGDGVPSYIRGRPDGCPIHDDGRAVDARRRAREEP